MAREKAGATSAPVRRTNLLVCFLEAENARWEFDEFGEIFRGHNELLAS
jgi:hypothetical protein